MRTRLVVPWAAPDWKGIGMLKKKQPFFAVVILSAGAALIGCHGGVAAPPRPAVEVGVLTVKPRPGTITNDLPRRTAPYPVARVRPHGSGVVLKRVFIESS